MKFIVISCLFFIIAIQPVSCTQDTPGKNPLKGSKYSKTQSLELEKLLKKANGFLDLNDLKNAHSTVLILKRMASSNKNIYYVAKSEALNGYIHLMQNRSDSAYYYHYWAKEHFLQLNDSLNIAKNLINMAIIQSDLGDYPGSETTAVEALKYLTNDTANLPVKISAYNSLAISSRRQTNYKEAIYWYNKSLSETNDDYQKAMILNNISASYVRLNEPGKSINILNKLKVDSIVIGSSNLYSKIVDNLAYAKWKQDPDRNVENQLQKALKIRDKNNDEWGQTASHSHLSEYFSNKNPEKSLVHAQKMYNIATKLNSPDDRLEALQKLITLESPQNAKQYAITYTRLSDSLVTTRNHAKDQFAKIRYDSEKNRGENQLLKIRDAEKQIQLERQKNIKILFMAGIIILGLSFLIFYLSQKNRIRRERLIATYESEVKMSKKVHDVLSNDIYRFIIRFQNFLSVNHSEKENLMVEIENIYEKSRQISKDLHDFDTRNFNNEIRALLDSYQSDSVKIIYNLLENEAWNQVNNNPKIELFRVLQELMTNMSKHSKATYVLIQFKKEKNIIKIIYRDNGVGIPVSQPVKKSGLANTENRMESINGSVTFESNKGKGLIIKITFPA